MQKQISEKNTIDSKIEAKFYELKQLHKKPFPLKNANDLMRLEKTLQSCASELAALIAAKKNPNRN